MRRALLMAALLSGGDAAANPIDLHGFGGRAPGMAGAQTADAEDASANYYNPAALARIDGVRFDLGYQLALPHLTIDGGDQHVSEVRGLALGVAIPMRLHGRRLFTIGVGAWLPDQQLLIARTFAANQPRWLLHDNRAQRFLSAAHIAVEPWAGLYLGAGVAVAATSSGSWILTGRLGYPDSFDSDLKLTVDVDATPVIYPQAGLLWQATPWLRVGATYRGRFRARSLQIIRFEADIGPRDQAPVVDDALLAIEAVALDMFQPAQLALGGSVQASPALRLDFDATFNRWSRFHNPTPVIDLDYDVGVFNDFVMIADALKFEDPNFHDTLTLRAGGELALGNGTRVRAGYSWDPSPAPEQVGESNFVDGDRHTLAAGAGVRTGPWGGLLTGPIEIDAYLSATWLPERQHRKLSPVDPIGDYAASGRILAIGLSTGWHF
ncbi:MAG TPA: outer membrane protein transport protein [Kofleriaceae bacterium]|jgi:long-chain fatty acid transport protein|nr:outer membrane protein transport protein [Kofleriaceae bacterium]